MGFCVKLIVNIPLIVIFVKKFPESIIHIINDCGVVNPIWKDFILIRPKK